MKEIVYVPIIKTADAEVRALENLSDSVSNIITPLLEFTRSRTTAKLKGGDILRKIKRLSDLYKDRLFFLDLTNDPNLTNAQIKELQSNENGYKNWTDFAVARKSDFSKFIPTIQISSENIATEDEHYARIRQQVAVLGANFDKLLYRIPIGYEFVARDITEISKHVPPNRLVCLLDAEYIPKDKASVYARNAIPIVQEFKKYSPDTIIIASTSFPKKPTQYGGESEGRMFLEEKIFFDKVKETEKRIVYGDYATIHPARNDQSGGNGWVPRIDMPTADEIFYFRDRKTKAEVTYADAYVRVAEKVVGTKDYQVVRKRIGGCWGIKQIEAAEFGLPQGLSPSYWISVRMNIHLSLTVTP